MTDLKELVTEVEKDAIRLFISKIRNNDDNPLVGPKELSDSKSYSRPRAYAILTKLQEKGLLSKIERKGFVLTDFGRQVINDLIHRTKVMETFFHTELGIDLDIAEEDAQHTVLHVSTELIEAICSRLGQPTSCPHNFKIPHKKQSDDNNFT